MSRRRYQVLNEWATKAMQPLVGQSKGLQRASKILAISLVVVVEERPSRNCILYKVSQDERK